MSKLLVVILLGLGCIGGVLLSAVRLPGIWLIVAMALLFGVLSDWVLIGVQPLLWIFGLAVLAEILEFAMSAITTHHAGGSRRAAMGSLIGGFLGLIFLSIPLPIIGSIVGALAGCFIGAAVGELTHRGLLSKQTLQHGTRVALFAAIGFAAGTATKVGIAFIVSVIAVASVLGAKWPVSSAAPEAPPVVAPTP